MASSSEARRKLEERLRLGPSTFNDVISTGGDSLRDPEDVARSFWEGLTATAEQTLKTLPTANLGNEVLRQQIEEEGDRTKREKLTPEEANTKYPYMGRPFNAPVDPYVADMLARRQRETMELQGIIDSASQGKIASGMRWTTQMAIGMFDPLNAVAGFGIGKAIGLAGRSMGSKALMFDAQATGARAFGRDFLQFSAGNLPLEPVNATLAARMQDEYTNMDSVHSLVTFPGALAGVIAGGRWAGPALRSIMSGARRADALAAQSAAAKMGAGKAVDSHRVVNDVITERVPTILPDPSQRSTMPISRLHERMGTYEHVPIKQPREFNKRTFFHAAEIQNDSLVSTRGHVMGRNLGPGIYLESNPVVANGYASSKYGYNGAGVFEVKINKENPNFIHLDKGLPQKAKDVVEALFEKWRPSDLVREVIPGNEKLRDSVGSPKPALSREFFKGKTAEQVIDSIENAMAGGMIPKTAMSQLNEALAQVGFDGFHADGGRNAVTMLFDPEFTGNASGKLQEIDKFAPDQSVLPAATMQDLQRELEHIDSIQSDALYHPDHYQRVEQMIAEPFVDPKLVELKDRTSVVDEELKAARERGALTEADEAEIALIEEEVKRGEVEDVVLKAALACMLRSP
jgi:hypothetical protein